MLGVLRSANSHMRLYRILRSRRVAAVLLVGLTVYAWIATLVVPGDSSILRVLLSTPYARAVTMAMGFEHPFSAPLFVVAVALATLSTAACAYERTSAAWSAFRAHGIAPVSHDRLLDAPEMVVAVTVQFRERTEVLDFATAALGRFRLKSWTSDGIVVASRRPVGLAGSAVFHWALVGVFVFVGLGQLTRYEGYANVLSGHSVLDAASGYDAELIGGPLFAGGYSGLILRVDDIDLNHAAGGVERGSAALVSLLDGERQIAQQWVYPNEPLRHGSLLVHLSDTPPVLLGSLSTDGLTQVRKVTLFYDFKTKVPMEFTLQGPEAGDSTTVVISPVGNQRLEVGVGNGSTIQTQSMGVGDAAELLPGQRLTIDELTYAAQLHVVNDWSVQWIYAMFVLGTLGVSAAVFIPTRRVSLMLVDRQQCNADGATSPEPMLHVNYSHRRNDPAFPRLLKEALEQAVGNRAIDDTREESL